MANKLLEHIVNYLKSYQKKVLLIEKNDDFFLRKDVISILNQNGIQVSGGSIIKQRIDFELKKEDTLLVLLSNDNSQYLEDIQKESVAVEFFLSNYLYGYSIALLINLDLGLLEKLFEKKQLIKLSKKETLREIEVIQSSFPEINSEKIDLKELIESLNKEEIEPVKNWKKISQLLSKALLGTIRTSQNKEVIEQINRFNNYFQVVIQLSYQHLKNSSPVKRPSIVSKILDYLNINFKDQKIALIVVDGMAYWQYELLKLNLLGVKNEDVIYSWLPSITQLSRQAIFSGDNPINEYKQGPVNEAKLWKKYWNSKGVLDFQIRYNHENINLKNLESVTKFAIVLKDLDEKMHASTDYKDLLSLTEHWIERSNISEIVAELLSQGFKIFLTTDHGNIQAKGWRGLKGREKLGTNKSGSRSQRHLEYSEQWLADEFIQNNPEIAENIFQEDNAIYFKNDYSFSNDDVLVTHGGSHLLEVLIPFIEINNE